MASRNETKALAAIEELRTATGRLAIFLRLDLADLRSVKAAATEFMRCGWLVLSGAHRLTTGLRLAKSPDWTCYSTAEV